MIERTDQEQRDWLRIANKKLSAVSINESKMKLCQHFMEWDKTEDRLDTEF